MTLEISRYAVRDIQALCDDMLLEERLDLARGSIVLGLLCENPEEDDTVRTAVRQLRDVPASATDTHLKRLASEALRAVERNREGSGDDS